MYKCVKFIVLLKHTLKNKHLIITLKKKKIPITRDINKEKKKVHNSRRTYIKGGKKKKISKRCFLTFFLVSPKRHRFKHL